MNYWLYAQGDIKGPFSADDLVSRNDFRLTSLVCLEDKLGETGDDWKCASEYEELSASLESSDKAEPSDADETADVETGTEVRVQPEIETPDAAEAQQHTQDDTADFSDDEILSALKDGEAAAPESVSADNAELDMPETEQGVAAAAGISESAETLELLKSLGYSEREAQQLVHFDGTVLEDSEQEIDFVRPATAENYVPAASMSAARPSANKKSAAGLPKELGEVAPAWISALKENELLQELAQDSSRFALDAAEPEEEEETAADYMAEEVSVPKKHKASRRAVVRYTEPEPQEDEEAEEPQAEESATTKRSRPEALPPVRKAVSEMVRQAQADDDTDSDEIEFPQEMVSPGLLDTEVYRPEEGEKTPRPAAAETPQEAAEPTATAEEVPPARNLSLSALAQDTVRKESSAEVPDGTLPPILMREDISTSAAPAQAQSAASTVSAEPASSPAPTAEPATVPGARQTADTGPFMGDIQARIAALSRTDKMNATVEPKTFPAVTAENSTDGKTQVPLPEALPGTLLADAFSKTSVPNFTQTPAMTSAPLPKPEPQPQMQQPSGFSKFQTQTQFPGGTVSGTVNDLRTVHVAAEVKNAKLTVAGNTAPGFKSGGDKKPLKKVLLIIIALLVVLGVMLTVVKMLGGKKAPPPPPEQIEAPPETDNAVDTSSETSAAVSPQDQNQPAPPLPPAMQQPQSQPAAQQPAADASAKSDLAIDIVRKYNLPGGKGTIENWFANTLVAGLGGEPYEEKWEGKSCYHSTCYVYYKLLQPRKEPIQYGFVVDTELKTIKSGINNKAVELLGGDDGMFSGKAQTASPTASQTYKPAQTSRPTAVKKAAVKPANTAAKKKAAAQVKKKRVSYGGESDQLPLPSDPNAGRKGARALIDDMSADEKAHYDSMMEDEYKKRHDVTDY